MTFATLRWPQCLPRRFESRFGHGLAQPEVVDDYVQRA
jgi:hypothetical protein